MAGHMLMWHPPRLHRPDAQVLARGHILSAPLVISPGLEDLEGMTPGEPAPSLVGWIDIRDLVASFVHREWAPVHG